MRCVVQRVRQASVTVVGRTVAEIGQGLLVLAGFTATDGEEQMRRMARKIVRLRVFDDAAGVMNLSVADVGGDILAVSQFTLQADMRKGNRPSYHQAAAGSLARGLYQRFVAVLEAERGEPVPTGEFGAEMLVSLVNDGPVTLILDSEAL